MDGAGTRVEEIDEAESRRLLESHSFVGRVGFVSDGRVLVLPVNYLAESNEIFFCTRSGTKLSVLRGGAPVAFEVDASRSLYHSGWSVMVSGTASEVTDSEELERLRRGSLKSWAIPSTEHWIRITIETISGRRIPEI
jgi:nitroimidazol reductase NimA-like FMN-containing flavoprotein (pyridoxamine 5'-phosphate oxidase superfamily)